MVQSLEELEKWHSNQDPWFYNDTPDDLNRREILRGVIPERVYKQVLDIGCGPGPTTRMLLESGARDILSVDFSINSLRINKDICKFINQ